MPVIPFVQAPVGSAQAISVEEQYKAQKRYDEQIAAQQREAEQQRQVEYEQAAPEPYVVISGVSTYGKGGKYGAASATDYTGQGHRIGTALGTWHLEGQNPVKSLLTRAATSSMYPRVFLTSSFYEQNKDIIEQWKADNPALASKVFLEGEKVDYGERFNIESRAQAKAIQDELKANWGGTLTPSARAIVEAPVGSDISDLLGKVKPEVQQLQAKAAYLQSPGAKYASQEAYDAALKSVTRFGIEVPKPAGLLVGTPEQNQLVSDVEGKQWMANEILKGGWIADSVKLIKTDTGYSMTGIRDPFASPTPLLTSLKDTTLEKPKEYFTQFGKMISKEEAERQKQQNIEKILKEVSPEKITLSDISKGAFKLAKEKADYIRGLTVDTSGVPKEVKESEGFETLKFVVPKVRESVARLVEFGGVIPATTELIGKTAISEPEKLVGMTALGTVMAVGGISEQVQKDPAQLVSDLAVFGIVTHGAGKSPKFVKSLGETEIGKAGKLYVSDLAEPIKPIYKPISEFGTELGKAGKLYTKDLVSPVSEFKYVGETKKISQLKSLYDYRTEGILSKSESIEVQNILKEEAAFRLEKAGGIKGKSEIVVKPEDFVRKEIDFTPEEWYGKSTPIEISKDFTRFESGGARSKILLEKDLVKLKPDFSVSAVQSERQLFPYGQFSKLTDRLVTPGEELVTMVGKKPEIIKVPETISSTPKPKMTWLEEEKAIFGEEYGRSVPIEIGTQYSRVGIGGARSRLVEGKPISKPEIIPQEWYGKSTPIEIGTEYSRIGIGGARSKITLPEDFVKLKPDYSVPQERQLFPYGRYSKLTDRLVTPKEELVEIPKSKLKELEIQKKIKTEESIKFAKERLEKAGGKLVREVRPEDFVKKEIDFSVKGKTPKIVSEVPPEIGKSFAERMGTENLELFKAEKYTPQIDTMTKLKAKWGEETKLSRGEQQTQSVQKQVSILKLEEPTLESIVYTKPTQEVRIVRPEDFVIPEKFSLEIPKSEVKIITKSKETRFGMMTFPLIQKQKLTQKQKQSIKSEQKILQVSPATFSLAPQVNVPIQVQKQRQKQVQKTKEVQIQKQTQTQKQVYKQIFKEIQIPEQVTKEIQVQVPFQIQKEVEKLVLLPKRKYQEDGTKKTGKEKFGYLYKPRASPIFFGDPYADKPINPLGEPKKASVKHAERKKSAPRGKIISKKVETFDLGLEKQKNKKNKKKKLWEV